MEREMPRTTRISATRAVVALVLTGAAVGLVACSEAVLASEEQAPRASSSAAAEVPGNQTETGGADVETPDRSSDGKYICGISAVDATDDAHRYFGYQIPILEDRGARPGANGTAELGPDGQPAAYNVVAGDTFTGVEQRFCTPGLYLAFVNSARRGTEDLYVGDVVNLSAYTILRVGTVNGEVRDLSPGPSADLMPPQR